MRDRVKEHLEDLIVTALVTHVEQQGHAEVLVLEVHVDISLRILVLALLQDALRLIVVAEHLVLVEQDLVQRKVLLVLS